MTTTTQYKDIETKSYEDITKAAKELDVFKKGKKTKEALIRRIQKKLSTPGTTVAKPAAKAAAKPKAVVPKAPTTTTNKSAAAKKVADKKKKDEDDKEEKKDDEEDK
ncbi:hypothetical protein RB653_000330 [Dictyostelium firmibasis]|uniref:Uncharacterized protein n=1 Tax=Dictyostelium firmibasis TaxID=79012 RepID=A0AAN7TUZ1_9MYCE